MQHKLQLENIQLLAKQAVEGFIIGLHKSPYHGFSVEFAEHRIYNPGDNLKHIDWKVFGKTDRLFVKKYEEETNLRCHVVIDTSSSMMFPENAANYNKLQFCAIASAAILEMLKKQQDAAGITLYDDSVYFNTESKSSSTHFTNLYTELENLLTKKTQNKGTNTAEILHQIAESSKRRRLIVLFSDMIDRASEAEQIIEALQHMRYNKHEVIIFQVQDKKLEQDFEFENRPYEFVDMETGQSIKMTSTSVKKAYTEKMQAHTKYIQEKCVQSGIDLIYADINQDFNQILLPYFLKRSKLY
jgi:uncharacterized protein (DUF58 family)